MLRRKDEDFKHFRDEVGSSFKRLGYPVVARKLVLKPIFAALFEKRKEDGSIIRRYVEYESDEELPEIVKKYAKRGWKYGYVTTRVRVYPVEENIYIVDEDKRIVFSNDDSIYGTTCYAVPYSNEQVCFPKKGTETPPEKVKKEPLERNQKEEFLIAVEEELEDDVALAHFAYYCRTRGGMPIMLDVDEGLEVACVGGKVDKYGVLSESVEDYVQILRSKFGDIEANRAMVLMHYGKRHMKAYGKTKSIIPSRRLREFGILLENVS